MTCREQGRIWRENHPGYNQKACRKYYESHGGEVRRSVCEWAHSHPEAVMAQNCVKTKLRNGKLQRPTNCSVCGKEDIIEAHHDNYEKPLDITWVCRTCHKRIHANLNLVYGTLKM